MTASRNSRERRAFDVIVIGAGAAGLEAAVRLKKAGFRVVVLEARERAGGRIDTRQDFGWPMPIDLGAEFVHGRPPELLRRLHDAGVRVRTLPPRHLNVRAGQIKDASALWGQAQELASLEGAPDITVDAFLRTATWRRSGPASARRLARAYLQGFNAADLGRASAMALHRQQVAADGIDGDVLGRPAGGYGRLVAHMASRLRGRAAGGADPLRLGVIVDRIRWRPGHVVVEVRSPDGVRLPPFEARAAVITVPIGVLQARPPARGAIRFIPPLPPPARRAIDAIAMGAVTKVVLRFNQRPWPHRTRPGLALLHLPGGSFPTFWSLREGPRPIVVAWAAGPDADRLAGGDANQLRSLAVATLARALRRPRDELEAQVDGTLVAAWRDDPFARGGYSYVPIDGQHAAADLSRPIADALFFAGEATETHGHAATVHGALMTGARAAGAATASLRSAARLRRATS